jgi:hypothetical protein
MIPIAKRLLFCARKAYQVSQTEAVPPGADDQAIGWLRVPEGFVSGPDGIDAGYIGETPSEIILAFRGTLPPDNADRGQMILDWAKDCDAALVAGDALPGLVHEGFRDALDALWNGRMREALTKYVAGAPAKAIHVVGHSKGGAVANLAAARICSQFTGVTPFVTTFAAARPGDQDFQTSYDRLVPNSIRYECQDDIVPHLPPSVRFTAMFAAVPFLAQTLDGLTKGYISVGDLYFIDWSNRIVAETPLLAFQRFTHLAELMTTLGFGTIVADHAIGPGSVYDQAPYS